MPLKNYCQLVLKSSDIDTSLRYQTANNLLPTERTTDFTGPNGSINRRQSQMIWRNINLRSILGPIYEDNCHYELELSNIAFFITSNAGSYSTSETDRCFNVTIQGLPNQQSYSSLGINQEAILSSVRLPNGAYCNSYNYNNNKISFKTNNNQLCDITITFRNLLNNNIQPQSNAVTLDYPYSQFTFNIIKSD